MMKQRTRTKALSWLLSLVLVLGLMQGMSLTAYADGETETAVLPTSAGNYILTEDITISQAWHPVDGITLNLGGHSITQVGSNTSDGSVIVVESGRTFTLKGNGSLTGGIGSKEGTYYVGGGVMVIGTFNMYGGTITGNRASGGNGDEGGGVWVGNGGTFNMYGGSITNNSGAGGGVGIGVNGWNNGNNPGTFNMSGGSISGNSSSHASGVRLNNGTFNMTGGTITGGDSNYDIRVEKDKNSSNKFNLSGNVTIGTIRFDGGMKANIAGKMTNDSTIVVYMDEAREFTNSSDVTYNEAERFTSGLGSYVVLKNSNGQLYLGSGCTVTYKVVGGTWADDTTANKTESVQSGSKPASVPTGMKASDGYTGGAWDTNPADATITEAKTFTYTFVEKTPANVDHVPTAKTLAYTGSAQELVNAGEATGGAMWYAIGESETEAPDFDGTSDSADKKWSQSIPTATDAGTYYVWYKVVGDADHTDTGPACVTVTISAPSYSDSTPSTTVTVPVSGSENSVNVSVTVSGSSATVRNESIDAVISDAAETGTVTIDVSNVGRTVTNAVIPAAMVEKITDAVADENNDADGLEVKLSTGAVTFDATALEAIAEQMTGRDLRLNLDSIGENRLNTAQRTAVNDLNVEGVYDAYMTSNNVRISDFKGGKATVSVPYALKEGQIARGIVVWYVAEDGARTRMPSRYADGFTAFDVPHFSNYVIAYDEALAAACPRDDTCPISAFTDASATEWYHDGVHFVLENGIMFGMGGGLFAPGSSTSRAMMAQILWNMEGKPVVNYAMSYTDVSGEAWYAEAVRWVSAEGIMDGYGGGKFGPNDAMTREQLAAIVYRYAKYKGVDVSVGEDTNILSYDDVSEVSEWAIPAMQWAAGSGAVGGRTASTLNPKDSATRAEIATIIMRYCTQIAA